MNPKAAVAVLGIGILVGSELVSEHNETLVPHQHTHPHFDVDSVVSTVAPSSASGAQAAAFDDSFDSTVFTVHHTYDQQMLRAALAMINSDEAIPPFVR